MAALFKRKKMDGTHIWYITYFRDGKPGMVSTRTGDKKLAMDLLHKFEEDSIRLAQGIKPAEKPTSILLSEFIKVYLDYRQKEKKAPRTISTDSYALNRLLNFAGDCSLMEITDELIRQYRDFKVDTLKPASASIELRSLRAAFNWAVEKLGSKYLRQNPFRQKTLIPQVEGRTMPMCLSPEEKNRFFAAIEEEEYLQLFKFILLTGCRRSEALNLTWPDVDLEQKQLTFRKTKTKKDRTIPINLELMQIIMALDSKRSRPFMYHPDWISHAFKNYLKKAGIERDLHLHSLRHTAASDLVRAGVHLTKIQKFLGHSSVKVTEIYTHVLPEDLREVAETLSCTG